MIDETRLKREDDESLRLDEESCPGCGKDLGEAIDQMENCPECGEEL